MIAAGYLLKHVVPPPEWLVSSPTHIKEVCSLAHCVSGTVAHPADSWQHNGFGLANSPDLLRDLAAQNDVDLTGAELFFYAAYELELESDGWTFDPSEWQPRTPDETSSVGDDVLVPEPSKLVLVGYDVLAVEYGDPHSPLSCNSMAAKIPVNASCLFDTFEDAKAAIDEGRFGGGCEPGAYTVFAVHRVIDPPRL
ncbi:hypothetical protein [Sphingosinicella sp. BN140058]|uniref:hypothetical protein n=1 Tax=Sphingosinicella sp. BN140058 TaxID=1892855 RepID=UPI001012624F|nr:hypothetical protein [Sphingosinicella sp. BN140058]QAY75600.1 hypothetical protein ETR14_02945 [Sphingosinicella sp. BN140058]